MKTRIIEVSARSAAPAEAVWELLADVSTWSHWGAFDESVLERPGREHPQGVGALRRFRAGRVHNQEEVVRFEPPYAFAYEVRAGDIPVRDYHADVELTPAPEGGTVLTWRSSFRARWPLAPLIHRRLQAFIADTAGRLAIAAQDGEHPMRW